jgi:hypothetical protein
MGHGHPHRLDFERTPIGGFPMFSDRDIPQVDCQQGHPIALMLACYTGAFDFPRDCLAEKLVNEPGGPIAALCGSRVTMHCGMSLLSLGLIEEYFEGRRQTLGEMFLAAKQKLVLGESAAADSGNASAGQSGYRDTIRLLGETLSPAGNHLQAEAREHAYLFHLLGDPLLRIPRPGQIELVADPAADGRSVRIRGRTPQSGKLTAELVYCRDRFHKRPPRRPEFKWDDRSLTSYRETYEQSNHKTVSTRTLTVPAGEFEFDLEVPDWARGRCVVRGFLQHPERSGYSLGASPLKIDRR